MQQILFCTFSNIMVATWVRTRGTFLQFVYIVGTVSNVYFYFYFYFETPHVRKVYSSLCYWRFKIEKSETGGIGNRKSVLFGAIQIRIKIIWFVLYKLGFQFQRPCHTSNGKELYFRWRRTPCNNNSKITHPMIISFSTPSNLLNLVELLKIMILKAHTPIISLFFSFSFFFRGGEFRYSTTRSQGGLHYGKLGNNGWNTESVGTVFVGIFLVRKWSFVDPWFTS